MTSVSKQNQMLLNVHSFMQLQNQQLQNNTFQAIPQNKSIQKYKNQILFCEQANKIYIRCLQQLKDSYSLNEKISCKTFKLFQKLFGQKIRNREYVKQTPTAKQIRSYHMKMLKRFGTTDKVIQELSQQDVYKGIKQRFFKKINKKQQNLNKNAIIKKGLMQKGLDGQKSPLGTVTIDIRQNLLKMLLLKHVRQCLIKGQYKENGDQKIYPKMKLPIVCHIPIKKKKSQSKKMQRQMQKQNLGQNDN